MGHVSPAPPADPSPDGGIPPVADECRVVPSGFLRRSGEAGVLQARAGRPVVEAYEWPGRRGDELVVAYRVWGGHPRRHEPRWPAIDLGTAGWAAGLAAPRVGALGDRPGPIPEWDSTEPVPVVPLFGPLEPDVANARDDHRPAGRAAVALYGRGGSAPELIVVTRDGAGALRFASWALRPTEDPGRAESAPGQLARGAAGVADVGTAPLQ
jgi:hypothetical protein